MLSHNKRHTNLKPNLKINVRLNFSVSIGLVLTLIAIIFIGVGLFKMRYENVFLYMKLQFIQTNINEI